MWRYCLWVDFLVTDLFEFNGKAEGSRKHFLITVALVFPFLFFLFFFRCLEFFLQETLPVTVEFGTVAVLTEFLGDVATVKFKSRIHEEAGKVCTYHRKQKEYGNVPFRHYGAKIAINE